MKFDKLKIKNFRTFGDKETVIDFSFTGKKLIVGPNGTGKSSIFSSLVFCLFGKYEDAIDNVVNWKTKKDTRVEFSFFIEEDHYSVVRYRKHDTHGNSIFVFKNNKDITLKNSDVIQKQIYDITGFTYNSFVSLCYFSYELYPEFLRARNSDRLKIIESVLPMNFIAKYSKNLKEKSKEISSVLDDIEIEISKNKHVIESNAKNKNLYIEETKRSVEQKEFKIKQYQREIEKEASDLELYKTKDINKIKKDHEILENNKKLESQITLLRSSLIDTDFQASTVKMFEKQYQDLLFVDVKKEREKYARKKELEDTIAENKKLREEKKRKEDQLEYANEKLASTLHSLEKKKKEKEDFLSHSETCPTCRQVIGVDKIEIVRQSFDTDIKKIEDILLQDKEAVASLVKEVDSIIYKDTKEEQEELKMLVLYPEKELDSIEGNREKLKSTIEDLKRKIEEGIVSNKEKEEKIKTLKSQIIEVEQTPDISLDHILKIEDLIKELEDGIKEKKSKIESMIEEIKTAFSKEFVEKIDKEIEEIEEKNSKLKAKKVEVSDDLNHYEYLIDLLSNNEGGFKKYLITKIIKYFNEKINLYSSYFFAEPITIEFDKNLNEVINYDGQEVSFYSFSSGQKTRIEVAIAIALFYMVKMFYTHSPTFIIFDEILDVNLDIEGLNSVNIILNDLAKDNGIYVISHNEVLKDKFESVLAIRKKKGFTEIEEL